MQKGELYFTLRKVVDPSSAYLTPDGSMMSIIPTGDRIELRLGGVDIEIDGGDMVWQLFNKENH